MLDSRVCEPVQGVLYLPKERPEQGGEAAHVVHQFSLCFVVASSRNFAMPRPASARCGSRSAHDSTTLTRTLRLLRKQGWIHARLGKDRRERLFSLTGAGKRQMAMAQPHW